MRGLGILAGVLATLCVVAPAHAKVLGPRAFIDVAPDSIGGINSPPELGRHLVLDVTRVKTGADVMVARDANGRLKIWIPGIDILSRAPGCSNGAGYAECSGPVEDITGLLGDGNDRWRAYGHLAAMAYGGAGNDALTSAAYDSELYGEDGDDRLLLTPSPRYAFAIGGPGDDRLEAQGEGSLHADDGNDTLVASPLGTSMYAGEGDDVLIGGAGYDALEGEGGNDRLEASDGNDYLNPGVGTDVVLGGEGRDRVSYYGVTGPLVVTLDGVDDDGGPGENDHLEGIEDVWGSGSPAGGDDRIVGDDLANDLATAGGENGLIDGRGGDDEIAFARNLLGGDGDDQIDMSPSGGRAEGGTGSDRIVGREDGQSCNPGGCVDDFHFNDVDAGSGDDRIQAAMAEFADAVPDAITCGDGWDVVEADHEDVVALDCEVVERR